MRKLIVILLILLLTGCGSSFRGTVSNKDKNSKELSKMETLIKQDKYDEVFFNFRKNYKDGNKKPTQKEIELYNKVVVTIFKKDIEKYFSSYENLALKEYISDKTKDKLDELTNKKVEELKKELTSAIENKKYNKITKIDSTSGSLQKRDQELLSMVAYGLYLKTYNTEKSKNRLLDSNGKLIKDSSGNINNAFLSSVHYIQVSVPPDYIDKYSDEIREIALMETPEFQTLDYSFTEEDSDYFSEEEDLNYSFTEEDWLQEYNRYNNIEVKEMEMKDIEIGMTQEEVINQTEWGKPQEINKTTSSYGVSEQWVYPDYKYLYFEDGILTVIQE